MQTTIAYSPGCNERQSIQHKARSSSITADLLAITFDLLIVWDVVSVGLGAMLSSNELLWGNAAKIDDDMLRLSVIGAVLGPVVLKQKWSHLTLSTMSPVNLIARILARFCLAALLISVVAIVTKSYHHLPPAWPAAWFLISLIGIIGGRFLMLAALRALAARGLVADRVGVLGRGPAADWLKASLAQARHYGVCTVSPAAARLEFALADLLERGRLGQLDRVVLALPAVEAHLLPAIAHRLKALEVEVTSLYPVFAPEVRALGSTQIAGVPLYLVTRRPQDHWGVLAKAIQDRVLALLLLLALSPVLALTAAAVRLDSPGPVIFRQRRHGLNGTEFEVFKFRTMAWQGAWAGSGEVQTSRSDSRITRVGAILRKTSLDELPQLLNVLHGTMSLVGPRPHPVSMRTEQRSGDEIIAEYAHRHRVKPGITGWAQVNGLRGATDTAEKLRRRVEHDIYYIEHWSLPFDLLILATTFVSMIFKRDNAF